MKASQLGGVLNHLLGGVGCGLQEEEMWLLAALLFGGGAPSTRGEAGLC